MPDCTCPKNGHGHAAWCERNAAAPARAGEPGEKHIGLWPERTVGDFPQAVRERAYAERWRLECSRHPILEHLCSRQIGNPLDGWHSYREPILTVGARDHRIAATLIQWLGSNVGHGFVVEALEAAGYRVVAPTRAALAAAARAGGDHAR